ncbi:hypothetical protein TheveDRAFT_0302 [Thermanaerovibrio velox DSM 12556]|uniref:Uncharacterized protein n=1 Tax=Thermanaerovibrio velox DSM 12556 TaxID=926567 RepID=H0UP59_9BACT|nr:DUF2993 domain-containing protein [Thermanaerovibrio velox]EHM09472.1 hypothetical protein TheveDRAFT_0302 [Thermanaerovibrio velox DSM 12556]
MNPLKLKFKNQQGGLENPKSSVKRAYMLLTAGIIAVLFGTIHLSPWGSQALAGEDRILSGDFSPSSQGEALLKDLVRSLLPEEMVVVLDQEPTNGEARHMYILARGAKAAGVRVDQIAMEAFFVKINPKGDEGGYPFTAIEGLFQCSVTDQDVNRFLKDAIMGSGENSWKGLNVEFQDGRLRASGTFCSKGISAVVRLDGALSIKDQSAVELKDYTVKVNGSETQMEEIRKAIRDAQPLLDLSGMPFPVKLKRISAAQGALTLGTEKEPAEFQGIRYVYQR